MIQADKVWGGGSLARMSPISTIGVELAGGAQHIIWKCEEVNRGGHFTQLLV